MTDGVVPRRAQPDDVVSWRVPIKAYPAFDDSFPGDVTSVSGSSARVSLAIASPPTNER
jgi:hypothetical protein